MFPSIHLPRKGWILLMWEFIKMDAWIPATKIMIKHWIPVGCSRHLHISKDRKNGLWSLPSSIPVHGNPNILRGIEASHWTSISMTISVYGTMTFMPHSNHLPDIYGRCVFIGQRSWLHRSHKGEPARRGVSFTAQCHTPCHRKNMCFDFIVKPSLHFFFFFFRLYTTSRIKVYTDTIMYV